MTKNEILEYELLEIEKVETEKLKEGDIVAIAWVKALKEVNKNGYTLNEFIKSMNNNSRSN